jgi:hypothetical protein
MAEHQLPKLTVRVRFSSPALFVWPAFPQVSSTKARWRGLADNPFGLTRWWARRPMMPSGRGHRYRGYSNDTCGQVALAGASGTRTSALLDRVRGPGRRLVRRHATCGAACQRRPAARADHRPRDARDHHGLPGRTRRPSGTPARRPAPDDHASRTMPRRATGSRGQPGIPGSSPSEPAIVPARLPVRPRPASSAC